MTEQWNDAKEEKQQETKENTTTIPIKKPNEKKVNIQEVSGDIYDVISTPPSKVIQDEEKFQAPLSPDSITFSPQFLGSSHRAGNLSALAKNRSDTMYVFETNKFNYLEDFDTMIRQPIESETHVRNWKYLENQNEIKNKAEKAKEKKKEDQNQGKSKPKNGPSEIDLTFAKPGEPRRVYVAIKIKRIYDIDNIKETFRCCFHMYFDWVLTRDEYEDYCKFLDKNDPNEKQWVPEYYPRYEFLNMVEEHKIEETEYNGTAYRVQIIKEMYEDLVGFNPYKTPLIRLKVDVDATFCEELELENFPVDCQDFTIVMRDYYGTHHTIFVPEIRLQDEKQLIASDFARVDPTFSVLDEWKFNNARVEFEISKPSEHSNTIYPMIKIRFKMRREWTVYFWNVIFFMSAIALLALMCFALKRHTDNAGNRLTLGITLLLTTIAFQYVIFGQLPNVIPTILHKYIITSFLFIGLISMESAFISLRYYSNDAAQFADNISFYFFFGIFIIYNIFFVIYGIFKRYEEADKLNMDSYELEKSGVEEKKEEVFLTWVPDKNLKNESDYPLQSFKSPNKENKDGIVKQLIDAGNYNCVIFTILLMWYGLLYLFKFDCIKQQTKPKSKRILSR